TEPALGRALLEGHAELRRLLIDQVALVLRGPGSELEAAGTTSPEALSAGLLATAGGLALAVLHGHPGSDEANRVRDAALACGLGKNTANGTEAGHDTRPRGAAAAAASRGAGAGPVRDRAPRVDLRRRRPLARPGRADPPPPGRATGPPRPT